MGFGFFEGSIGNFFGNNAMGLFFSIVFLTVALAGSGFFAYWKIFKSRAYNLIVEIKIPRGLKDLDENEELDPTKIQGIAYAEIGKGAYSVKRGCVFIKRKGKRKAVEMPPFDPKKYLQGEKILTVIQVGAEKYIPVLPESFLVLEDDKTGQRVALLSMKGTDLESRAWKNQFERESKSAFTIMGILKAYLPYIGFSILFFSIFAGFAVIYNKITVVMPILLTLV